MAGILANTYTLRYHESVHSVQCQRPVGVLRKKTLHLNSRLRVRLAHYSVESCAVVEETRAVRPGLLYKAESRANATLIAYKQQSTLTVGVSVDIFSVGYTASQNAEPVHGLASEIVPWVHFADVGAEGT